ncbi:hypothetical protein [Sphingobium sp.]|uniref:hypothetical protein n=1 Tax=Sphingobium sp. TaxID=1912891 RepID=UPI001A19F167|nr:hypothetical protein [Sphingobium sp.]MBJ7378532.1 hypothetical protein [Sphingobium sp.]
MTGKRDRDTIVWPGERKPSHSRVFPNELVEKARTVFQKRTSRKLTNEDARQMLENLTGFFRVLHEWDRAQRKSERNSRGDDAEAEN